MCCHLPTGRLAHVTKFEFESLKRLQRIYYVTIVQIQIFVIVYSIFIGISPKRKTANTLQRWEAINLTGANLPSMGLNGLQMSGC